MKLMSVWISYKGRLIRKYIEILIPRCWRMNGVPQTRREEANAIPILWWRRDDVTARVSLRAAAWWMSAAWIINCWGQFIPVKRPTLIERTTSETIPTSAVPSSTHFHSVSELYVLSDGGGGGIIKLFSQVSCGPRWREGILARTHLRGELQQRPR